MGLTREQRTARNIRDAEKVMEYYAHPKIQASLKKKAQDERDRITAMGMLLDAQWSQTRGLFVKGWRDEIGVWHQQFWNRWGEPCTMDGYRLNDQEEARKIPPSSDWGED